MKTVIKDQISKFKSSLSKEYKDIVDYIIRMPYKLEDIDIDNTNSVFNMFVKCNENVSLWLREYYLFVSFVIDELCTIHKEDEYEKDNFNKIFIKDVVSFFEIYCRLLKYKNIHFLNNDEILGAKEFVKYMRSVYLILGKDIYKKVFNDFIDFVSNSRDSYFFSIMFKFPFLCSIGKAYFIDCLNVYKERMFEQEYDIMLFIHKVYSRKLSNEELIEVLKSSMREFGKIYNEIRDNSIQISTQEFLVYFFFQICNKIYGDINVNEIFKLGAFTRNHNIFILSYRGRKNEYFCLSPRIFETFVNIILGINKKNSNILNKMFNYDHSIVDMVCNIVLYDIIVNEVKNNSIDSIIIKTDDHLKFIDQYFDILSKFESKPSFLIPTICNLDPEETIKSVAVASDRIKSRLYNFSICDIYLNNSNLLYNIITSKGFSDFYYKNISSNKYDRNIERSFKYWISFDVFMGCMEVINGKKRHMKFDDYMLEKHFVSFLYEYILDQFIVFICFVVIPILAQEKNNRKYINKIYNSVTNMTTFSLNINEKGELLEYLAYDVPIFSRVFNRIIRYTIFMCLIYYFGTDLLLDRKIQNAIKKVIENVNSNLSEHLFDVLYSIYKNIELINTNEQFDFLINIYKYI